MGMLISFPTMDLERFFLVHKMGSEVKKILK